MTRGQSDIRFSNLGHPQVGIGKVQTYSAAGGRTQLFYSRTTCAGRAVRIHRLSNR